jgi:hypothetical protein
MTPLAELKKRPVEIAANLRSFARTNDEWGRVVRGQPELMREAAALLDHIEVLEKALTEIADTASSFLPLAEPGSRLHRHIDAARAALQSIQPVEPTDA